MDKREKEKKTISKMIHIYHKGKHKGDELCIDCAKLERYAYERIDRCPFMATKSFCSNCKVHCYRGDMRKMIKEVMRYSGPRMLYHDPIMAIDHLISTIKERKNK